MSINQTAKRSITLVYIRCDYLFEWKSVRNELACIISDCYYEGVIFEEMDVFLWLLQQLPTSKKIASLRDLPILSKS
jgi:hypothetical protein